MLSSPSVVMATREGITFSTTSDKSEVLTAASFESVSVLGSFTFSLLSWCSSLSPLSSLFFTGFSSSVLDLSLTPVSGLCNILNSLYPDNPKPTMPAIIMKKTTTSIISPFVVPLSFFSSIFITPPKVRIILY